MPVRGMESIRLFKNVTKLHADLEPKSNEHINLLIGGAILTRELCHAVAVKGDRKEETCG